VHHRTPPSSASDRKGKQGFTTLRPYLSLLRGQERDLVTGTLLMVVAALASLLIPIQAGRFVDRMGENPALGLSVRGLGILLGLLILQLAASFFFSVVSARLGLRTTARLRRRLFAHLIELPSLFFTRQKAGDLSTRVSSDVEAIQSILTSGLVSLARALLTLVLALIIMLNLNQRLTTLVVILIPATILLVRFFGSRLRRLSRRMFDDLGRISSHVQETVGSIRSLKIYNNQNHEQRRFTGMVDDYRDAGLSRAWLSAGLESGIQFTLWVCLLGVFVYGFTLAGRGEATGGQLVTFLLLAFRVTMPLASLTHLYSAGQGAIAAASRLDEIFDLEPEREPGAEVPPPHHEASTISLVGVDFRYPETPEGQNVLSGITAEIEAGRWVGIVGPSGSGKTTLAGLMMGLFPPTAGSLRLDGRPYLDFDLSELRSRMAFVAQDPVLNDMSLADNIRFGLTDATEEAVRDAAGRAGVLEFADRLDEGLDTEVGERGARLSGGQRQRVALARAFLRDPGVLVLDEPTSALDSAAEEAIRTSLKELMTGRTAVVIAHRLSLVRELDLILVLSEGRLVESGTHQELMEIDGLYRTLYRLQQGEIKT